MIVARPTCPLCNSSARQQVDLLLSGLLSRPSETVNVETGEIEQGQSDINFAEIHEEVKKLLAKIPEQKTEAFGLDDVIVHATKHPLVTSISGIAIRREGDLLFQGDDVYKIPDHKSSLNYIIVKGLQEIDSGKLKITGTLLISAIALLFRNSGGGDQNEMLEGIRAKLTQEGFDKDSPLGKGLADYEEKQKKAEAVATDG